MCEDSISAQILISVRQAGRSCTLFPCDGLCMAAENCLQLAAGCKLLPVLLTGHCRVVF